MNQPIPDGVKTLELRNLPSLETQNIPERWN